MGHHTSASAEASLSIVDDRQTQCTQLERSHPADFVAIRAASCGQFMYMILYSGMSMRLCGRLKCPARVELSSRQGSVALHNASQTCRSLSPSHFAPLLFQDQALHCASIADSRVLWTSRGLTRDCAIATAVSLSLGRSSSHAFVWPRHHTHGFSFGATRPAATRPSSPHSISSSSLHFSTSSPPHDRLYITSLSCSSVETRPRWPPNNSSKYCAYDSNPSMPKPDDMIVHEL